MSNFNLGCEYCTTANTCELGHNSCDPAECEDFVSFYNYQINNYEFDAYDYFDAYQDDKDDGLIPPDYEL